MSALQARLWSCIAAWWHTCSQHRHFLSAQTPHASCCAAGLQAKMLDSSAVTTAKLTAAAILMMVLSNQVTTG